MHGNALAFLFSLTLAVAACGGDTAPPGDDTSDVADAVDTADVALADTVADVALADTVGVAPDSVSVSDSVSDSVSADTTTPATPPELTAPETATPGGEELAVQPALAIGSDGRVLVAWTGRSDDALDIQRALLDPSGAEVAAAARVNTDTRGLQNEPAACALSGGGYVIAWSVDTQESGPDGENLEVRLRRLDADGAPLDPAGVRVLTDVPGNHWLADVACAPDGGFVVAGVRPGDGPGFSVFFQRFDAEGAAGDVVTVLPSTSGGQAFPAVAVDAAGAVLVAWEDTAGADADTTVVWRRFPAVGEPSALMTVATAHGVDASGAAVAADPSDGALALAANLGATAQLAWLSGADATPTPVTAPGTGVTSQVTLAPLGGGRFAAVWFSGSGSDVAAHAGYFDAAGFDADLTLASGYFPLAYRPALAYGDGLLAAAWTESLGGGEYAVRVAIFAGTSK